MKIKRVLNNNTAISENHNGLDVLLMGPGIAFGKKKGQEVDISKVEKTFIIKDQDTMNKFTDLVMDVPMNEILIAEKIINFAKIKLGKQLNEIIYVNLTDHLHTTIQRYHEKIVLKNPLKWDIARFYPDEFAVGQKFVEVVKNELGITLEDDESAFVALHFVNAETETGDEQNLAYDVTNMIKEVEDIVKDYYNTEFDESSLNYYRFITHLKFFAQRVLQNKHYDDDADEDLLQTLKKKYAVAYNCARKIQTFVRKKYDYEISSTELLYLTVHIRRLVKNL
ncbi:Beta-glucoside bgl operon antiterminator, BglG family [Pediococcus damnosus]|uniref:Beta-glucoside bgl operon antiterminator, BglG family n=1 Tax=Pediococcus damnosus TaxID=51663 RepID=A0A143AFW6_9LACO|nr:PRD domain-containing protein [Pediococcus damnosus]AMV63116.1 Beta-glucoside bgl operon antiterminator, BglG family [Pediococcus damnosus]AMV66992.1 Beta-glucoside bgl operon antiterminator, BglG family [Pediococcus damnosus]AMV69407.1 Beta-glucoside bgl operon antiterminator, BglG family [Pediococcus damnosus]KJU73492.1 transcription antiterminator BglG [Pediococcus damnosus LMG 28219]PIO81161.1 transcription antiterminator BglG [Pediococcus damnosus]